MTTLAEELAAETEAASDTKNRCKLGKVLDGLPPKDASALENAIENPLLSAERVLGALSRNGISVGQHTYRRHWRKACVCYGNS